MIQDESLKEVTFPMQYVLNDSGWSVECCFSVDETFSA